MMVQNYIVGGFFEASFEIAGESWLEIIRADSAESAMQVLISSLTADNITGYDKIEISPLKVIGVASPEQQNPS